MAEALKPACRIGVMHQGRLPQVATPQDIQNHPADGYVRSLFSAMQVNDSAARVIATIERLDSSERGKVWREYCARQVIQIAPAGSADSHHAAAMPAAKPQICAAQDVCGWYLKSDSSRPPYSTKAAAA